MTANTAAKLCMVIRRRIKSDLYARSVSFPSEDHGLETAWQDYVRGKDVVIHLCADNVPLARDANRIRDKLPSQLT